MTIDEPGLSDAGRQLAASRPFSAATAGGTFNTFHEGHREYLRIALGISDVVHISVTSDEFARSLKSYHVRPYDVRCKELEVFLDSMGAAGRCEFHELSSEAELARFVIENPLDVAVVEPRYFARFQELNHQRRDAGRPEYCILLKPRTRIDGAEVSSTSLEIRRTQTSGRSSG